MIINIAQNKFWKTHALLIARLIFGGMFIFAAVTKFLNTDMMSGMVASLGFPFPTFFLLAAAVMELLIAFSIITGVYFAEATLLAAFYILFLGVAYYGPSTWASNQMDLGLFISHLTQMAGLLFMTAHGAGQTWRLKK